MANPAPKPTVESDAMVTSTTAREADDGSPAAGVGSADSAIDRGVNKCLSNADLFRTGRQAEQTGHFAEALTAYELALGGSPDQHPWFYRKGCVLMKMDRCSEAESTFRQALELAPDTCAYLTNLGVCLDRLGRRDEAVQAYRSAGRQGAGTAVAHHNLGAIFAEQGRTQEAIRSFEAALAVEPDAEGWLNLGLVHYGGSDFADALVCFEQAVTCEQSFARGHYYAALCLLKTGVYHDSLRRFELAWKLDPRLARVPFHLGCCLHKLARYSEARQSLEQALEFFPEDSRVHYQMGLTCDALGLPHEARPHYSQARTMRDNRRTTS